VARPKRRVVAPFRVAAAGETPLGRLAPRCGRRSR
ncbi:ORFL207W, partial [Human betaherpesvirus 5]